MVTIVIILIIIVKENENIEILLWDTNFYDSINQPLLQLPYINNFLSLYNSETNVSLVLDGFINHHRNLCNKDDCPSKRRIVKTSKFSKMLRQEGKSE